MDYLHMKLYLAIKNNDLARVNDALRQMDLTRNEFFDDKVTFISLAILNNNLAIVRKLIESGADVNRISYLSYDWPQEGQPFTSFEPALITATRHGDARICKLLIDNHAKVNKADSFNMSALHWAVSLNLTDVVRLLLDQSNINCELLDHKNQTPVERAIMYGHVEMVRMFAERAELKAKFREYLLAAIMASNPDILSILLDQIEIGKIKFNLNKLDDSDSIGTMLHHAVLLSNMPESSQRMMIGRHALQRLQTRHNQLMPVSKIRVVENLINNGKAEINIVNKLGETPLHMCRNLEVARLLLERGAVMNICEITGKMPLFTYILSAHYDMCFEMLKNGCDLENIDRLGNSLFNVLIKSNAPLKLILLLLEAGLAFEKEEWVRNKQYTQVLVEKYPELIKLIEYKLKNPPSLKEAARKSLRTHLNKVNNSKSIVSSVLKMDKILPSTLQDYVLLNLNKNRYDGVLLMR